MAISGRPDRRDRCSTCVVSRSGSWSAAKPGSMPMAYSDAAALGGGRLELRHATCGSKPDGWSSAHELVVTR